MPSSASGSSASGPGPSTNTRASKVGWSKGERIRFVGTNDKGETEDPVAEIAESDRPSFLVDPAPRHHPRRYGGHHQRGGEGLGPGLRELQADPSRQRYEVRGRGGRRGQLRHDVRTDVAEGACGAEAGRRALLIAGSRHVRRSARRCRQRSEPSPTARAAGSTASGSAPRWRRCPPLRWSVFALQAGEDLTVLDLEVARHSVRPASCRSKSQWCEWTPPPVRVPQLTCSPSSVNGPWATLLA